MSSSFRWSMPRVVHRCAGKRFVCVISDPAVNWPTYVFCLLYTENRCTMLVLCTVYAWWCWVFFLLLRSRRIVMESHQTRIGWHVLLLLSMSYSVTDFDVIINQTGTSNTQNVTFYYYCSSILVRAMENDPFDAVLMKSLRTIGRNDQRRRTSSYSFVVWIYDRHSYTNSTIHRITIIIMPIPVEYIRRVVSSFSI